MVKKGYALIISCLLVVSSASSSILELKNRQVLIPERLGDITLCHDSKGFFIKKDNEIIEIQNAYVDKKLWNINNEVLQELVGNGADVRFATQEEIDDIDWEEAVELDEEIAKSLQQHMESALSSAYIQVEQLNEGGYALHLKIRLPGGGAFGAWLGAIVGKAAVSCICHGGIWVAGAVASAVGTPALGFIVVTSLESTLGASIEAASITAALAVGIAGGVATGPV